MITHNQNRHTSIDWSSCEKARQTPFVINELIQINDYLEASTFAFFIQLKTACKKNTLLPVWTDRAVKTQDTADPSL